MVGFSCQHESLAKYVGNEAVHQARGTQQPCRSDSRLLGGPLRFWRTIVTEKERKRRAVIASVRWAKNNRDRVRKNGLRYYYRHWEEARQYRLEHRSERNEYNRKWDKEHPEKKKERSLKWNNKNPEKVSAETKARKEIPLEEKCRFCSNRAVHRHHPDYSKPLLVWSVCAKCHKAIHRGEIGNERLD